MVVKKLINSILGFLMLVSCLGPSIQVYAYDALPVPNQILALSATQKVPLLRGLKINPQDPFDFKFIIDSPDAKQLDQAELNRLFDYFLTSLTLKGDKFWVNLSPNEKDRIIDDSLAVTQMGKDMLEQDYLLKQLSSSLTDPETQLGSKYWNLVGAQHAAPENSKIWIESDGAELFEHKDTVVINEMSLNVTSESERYKPLLEEISNDVNNGSNFSRLRQLYSAFILASWFKEKFVDSFYKEYIDQNKLGELQQFDASHKYDVFSSYLKSYRNGVYQKNIKVTSDKGIRQKRNYCVGGVRLQGKYANVDSFTKFSSPVALVDTKLNADTAMSSSLKMPELSSEMKLLFKRIELVNSELLKYDYSSEALTSLLYNQVLDEIVELRQAVKTLADENGITDEIFVLNDLYELLDEKVPSASNARKEGLPDEKIRFYSLFEALGQTIEHFVKIQELPNEIDVLLDLFDTYHAKTKSTEAYGGKESDNGQYKDFLTNMHALQEFGKNLEYLSYIYEKILMMGYGRDAAEKARLDNMLMGAFVSHICSYVIRQDEESTGRRFEAIEELSKIFYRGSRRVRQVLFESLIKDEGMYDKLIKEQLKAKNKKRKSLKRLKADESQATRNQIKMLEKQIKGFKVVEHLFFTTLEYTYMSLHEDELDQFVAFVFMQLKKAAREEFEFIDNDSIKNSKIVIELIKSVEEHFKRKTYLVDYQFQMDSKELKELLKPELYNKLEKALMSSSIFAGSSDSDPNPIYLPIVVDRYNAVKFTDRSLLDFWYELFSAIHEESNVVVNILYKNEKYVMGIGLFNMFSESNLVDKGDSIKIVLEGTSRKRQRLVRELLEEVISGRKYHITDSLAAKTVVPRYLKSRIAATLDNNISNAYTNDSPYNGGIEFDANTIKTINFNVPSSFKSISKRDISELHINIEDQRLIMPEDSYLLFN